MNTDELQASLEQERALLESELSTVAVKDSGNPGGYVGKEPEEMMADNNVTGIIENSAQQEEFSKNQAISSDLETRLSHVKQALANIEAGTYGTCKECSEQIEQDRLEANPSAQTCKAHM